jgi:hypothetical protein
MRAASLSSCSLPDAAAPFPFDPLARAARAARAQRALWLLSLNNNVMLLHSLSAAAFGHRAGVSLQSLAACLDREKTAPAHAGSAARRRPSHSLPCLAQSVRASFQSLIAAENTAPAFEGGVALVLLELLLRCLEQFVPHY